MKIKPLSWLLSAFNVIRNENVLAGNTKTRIAEALERLSKAAIMEYDPDAPTDEGQTVLFKDNLYTALEDLPKGKGPDSDKATSWRTGFIVSLDQLKTGGGKLVTAAALQELRELYDKEGAKNAPYATDFVAGLTKFANEEEHNKGLISNKAATPKWVKKLIDGALKAYEELTWHDVLTSKSEANLAWDITIGVHSLHTGLNDTDAPPSGFGMWVRESPTQRRLVELSIADVKKIMGYTDGTTIPDPTKKTITGFTDIDGPASIDEGNMLTQYLPVVIFSDGSTGKVSPSDANGFIRIIEGQGEQVDQNGVVPIYTNSVTGDTRTFVLKYGHKLPGQTDYTYKSKTITINDRSVSQGIVIGNLMIPMYTDDTLDDFYGIIDGISCADGVRVWGVNFTYQNSKPNFDIIVDGKRYASKEAHIGRSDVSVAYGLHNTTGHIYGMSWPIPVDLQDGRPHSYSVNFSGTTIPLAGDPVTLTCGTPQPEKPVIVALDWSWRRVTAGSSGGNTIAIWLKVDGPSADIEFIFPAYYSGNYTGVQPTMVTTTLKDSSYANDSQGYTHFFEVNPIPGQPYPIEATPIINGQRYDKVTNNSLTVPTGASTPRTKFYPPAQ